MFHLLDATLREMLDDTVLDTLMHELYAAEVSFITPDKSYPANSPTVNLFLYETRENRELRDQVPTLDTRNALSVRRRPPLRVDCAYMVTTWSNERLGDKVVAEHRLLSQAFNWLSRFPEIPERYLQAGGLTSQVYTPPTLVAQMDAAKNVGEFWTALGIAPRPFFNLIVTITMDLDQAFEAALVTSVLTTYRNASSGGDEERIVIGGTVRDQSGNAVRDAWVLLQPAGLTRITDASGHFIFSDVARGTGISLHARAPDHGTVDRANLEIPSLSGEYDLQF